MYIFIIFCLVKKEEEEAALKFDDDKELDEIGAAHDIALNDGYGDEIEQDTTTADAAQNDECLVDISLDAPLEDSLIGESKKPPSDIRRKINEESFACGLGIANETDEEIDYDEDEIILEEIDKPINTDTADNERTIVESELLDLDSIGPIGNSDDENELDNNKVFIE